MIGTYPIHGCDGIGFNRPKGPLEKKVVGPSEKRIFVNGRCELGPLAVGHLFFVKA